MRKLISTAICMLALSASSAFAGELKEWTFLVFLNGHNNLDHFGTADMNEMEKAGSNENVNIVVQWASMKANTKRILVKKDNSTAVTSPVVQDIGVADMGDWKALVDFVEWGVKNYPAKRYMIDVWNHGNGWHKMAINSGDININDISYDDRSGHHITTEQLADAMAASAKIIGHKVDLYGSDACLMAMAEVASQMVNSVSYFLGSEEVEPGEGWPYDTFLTALYKKNDWSPASVASVLTEEYVKSYQNGSQGNRDVQLSSFNLEASAQYHAAVAGLSKSILDLNSADKAKVKTAMTQTQTFYSSDYKDLADFALLVKRLKLARIPNRVFEDFDTAHKAYVNSNHFTSEYARAQGVSVWMPTTITEYNRYADRYSKLTFDRESSWGNVLRFLNM